MLHDKEHQAANLKALSVPMQRQQLWEIVKTGNGRCGARLLNTTLFYPAPKDAHAQCGFLLRRGSSCGRW